MPQPDRAENTLFPASGERVGMREIAPPATASASRDFPFRCELLSLSPMRSWFNLAKLLAFWVNPKPRTSPVSTWWPSTDRLQCSTLSWRVWFHCRDERTRPPPAGSGLWPLQKTPAAPRLRYHRGRRDHSAQDPRRLSWSGWMGWQSRCRSHKLPACGIDANFRFFSTGQNPEQYMEAGEIRNSPPARLYTML